MAGPLELSKAEQPVLLDQISSNRPHTQSPIVLFLNHGDCAHQINRFIAHRDETVQLT